MLCAIPVNCLYTYPRQCCQMLLGSDYGDAHANQVQSLTRHASRTCTTQVDSARGSFVTCSVIALVDCLILGAWTLPEVLHCVEHVSQCFVICRPQTLLLAADCAILDVEHLLVERLQRLRCVRVLLPFAIVLGRETL